MYTYVYVSKIWCNQIVTNFLNKIFKKNDSVIIYALLCRMNDSPLSVVHLDEIFIKALS